MKTKTGKKVTALLTGVLLLGVTTTSVLAASSQWHRPHEASTESFEENNPMTKLSATGTSKQPMVLGHRPHVASTESFEENNPMTREQKILTENSTKGLRYDFESGWVTK